MPIGESSWSVKHMPVNSRDVLGSWCLCLVRAATISYVEIAAVESALGLALQPSLAQWEMVVFAKVGGGGQQIKPRDGVV